MVKNDRFLIKTKSGFKSFEGISKSKHNEYVELYVKNDKGINKIITSNKHMFYTNNGFIDVKDIKIGEVIYGEYDKFEVVDKQVKNEELEMFDIIEVNELDNSFLIDEFIITHNCQFLSYEKTLIDTDILKYYETDPVISEIDGIEFYSFEKRDDSSIFVITIDPSGTGEDNSVLQLWDVSSKGLYQTASIADKNLGASDLYEKIILIQKILKEKFNFETENAIIIFERNGVGEALVQILTQTEKALEELEIPIYYDNRNKPGVNLNQKLKNKLATLFKMWFEGGVIKVNDKEMIDELYGFVKNKRGSFSAQAGYTDDRIMATFYLIYFVMNDFLSYAGDDFSVDELLFLDNKKKVETNSNNEKEIDPAEYYRKKYLEKNNKEINKNSKQEKSNKKIENVSSISIVEEENDDDKGDIDLDDYDILPVII
jgi:hypothetical protein